LVVNSVTYTRVYTVIVVVVVVVVRR